MKKLTFILAALFLFALCPFRVSGQEKGYNDEAMLAEAVTRYNNEDFSGAHRILSRLLENNPDNDAANYYMGLVRFVLGNTSGAEGSLKKAVSLDSGNFWYRYRLAVLYARTDRPELTISIYERLLEDFPKKTELYYTLIDLYTQQGQYDDALSTLSQIETVFGETDATAYARFDLMRMKGDPKSGYEYLKKYNEGHASSRISSLLGDYYLSLYDKDSAMIMYQEALALEPDFPPAILSVADIYRMDSDYGNYFSYINRFLTNPYISTQIKSRYINEAFTPNDPYFLEAFMPEIDTLMENTLAVSMNDSLINMAAGYYYFFTMRPDRAASLFRENVRMAENSKPAWSNYLMILYSLQRWDEYYAATSDAVARFGDDPHFIEQRGVACIMKNDLDEAFIQFDRLIAFAGGDTSVIAGSYSVMGDICHQQGNSRQGNRYYDKALKLEPDNLPVLNNYAYYLSVEGKNLKKAAAMGKKCVDAEPDNPTYLDTYGWILHLLGRSYEAKDLFRHAMLYGGRESAVVLDHYAEILYSLGDRDLAFLYWQQAIEKNSVSRAEDRVPGLEEKVARYKAGQKD